MSPIKKILKYFFHHSFSGEMVDRVHQRLAEPGDEREKEEVLREIWNEIGFPEADKRRCQAARFYGAVRTFRQAGADHLARW